MFKKVTILGPGLIGGSIALAMQDHFPEISLALWGRREEVARLARSMGISGATSDFKLAVSHADLIILATPVGIMPSLVQRLSEFNSTALLTDVGSVKRMVHESVRPLVDKMGMDFIGSHPMAGSEKTGMEAARKDLLTDAACILTNDEEVEESRLKMLGDFWAGLGCRLRFLSAEDHDYAVARISHFPHTLAAVGASVGLAFEDIVDLAGGGMRDTTRVAAGDPQMWTEILLENSDALQRSLGECISELTKVQEMLRVSDSQTLFTYLEEARRRRLLL